MKSLKLNILGTVGASKNDESKKGKIPIERFLLSACLSRATNTTVESNTGLGFKR